MAVSLDLRGLFRLCAIGGQSARRAVQGREACADGLAGVRPDRCAAGPICGGSVVVVGVPMWAPQPNRIIKKRAPTNSASETSVSNDMASVLYEQIAFG